MFRKKNEPHRSIGVDNILDNTLTANYEYSHNNRKNLPLQTQIKLSKKPSNFCVICL